MADAKKDNNRVADGLAWDGTTTQRLLVDPVTGRLEILIAAAPGGSPIVHTVDAERDNNRVHVALGVTDDANSSPIPLHVDSASGFLAVDLIIA